MPNDSTFDPGLLPPVSFLLALTCIVLFTESRSQIDEKDAGTQFCFALACCVAVGGTICCARAGMSANSQTNVDPDKQCSPKMC